jgi:hypothetical protein
MGRAARPYLSLSSGRPQAGPVSRDPIKRSTVARKAKELLKFWEVSAPAKAGTHFASDREVARWIPAFAGIL